MRLVKVPAMQLQPGMFVAELDRPWLETPFVLQGFMIQNDDEVLHIADYVDYVYIDADYQGSPRYLPARIMDRKQVAKKINIKAEFEEARVCFESATQTLDRVFDSLRHGRQTDISAVTKTVRPLLDGVFHNKEALAALVRLQKASDYRYNHGISMAVWAAILGRHIGLHHDELEKLVVGCAMCDVGMTKLSHELLERAGPLNEDERESIKQHTLIGSKMVADSGGEVDFEVLAIIENHHERFDGSGYPRGVEGATIPLLARIAGLVDAYDAMITPRSYARGRSSFEATQELIEAKGTLFQDVLVEQFIQAIGLFPTGSLVELNNGEVAIVVKQNPQRRLKPEIVVILDTHKKAKTRYELIDLAHESMTNLRWIAHELQPGTYGINSEDFFL